MDKEMKQTWVEALRSGKYQQGTHALRNDNNYCCLGVLCDLNDPSLWIIIDYDNGSRYSYLYREGLLSDDLTYKYDIPTLACEELAAMNDNGFSFIDIADWIDQKL